MEGNFDSIALVSAVLKGDSVHLTVCLGRDGGWLHSFPVVVSSRVTLPGWCEDLSDVERELLLDFCKGCSAAFLLGRAEARG